MDSPKHRDGGAELSRLYAASTNASCSSVSSPLKGTLNSDEACLIETLQHAYPYRLWPLGELAPVPPDSAMLTEEQVVTCVSVLLHAMLNEFSALNYWVTDYINLRLMVESGCPGDLQAWLQSRDVTIYVVACLGPAGFVQEGDGHFVCLAIDSPASHDCKVRVYDSKGIDSITWRWCHMRAELAELAKWVGRMKYGTEPVPRAELMPVKPVDVQADNASCGFHVALFIARDCARREGAGGMSSAGSPRQAIALQRLEQLRNCPANAQVLREWLEGYFRGFGHPTRPLRSSPVDRNLTEVALEELCSKHLKLDDASNGADLDDDMSICPPRKCCCQWFASLIGGSAETSAYGSAREPLRRV